ncbi:hypothetical protein E2542_SST06220 [Spatholobus suberectus]|nr:hypothetical protein E2542_SST06220 [Spatholobus suberectus]
MRGQLSELCLEAVVLFLVATSVLVQVLVRVHYAISARAFWDVRVCAIDTGSDLGTDSISVSIVCVANLWWFNGSDVW